MKSNLVSLSICYSFMIMGCSLTINATSQIASHTTSFSSDSIPEQVELLKLYYSKIKDSLLSDYEQQYFDIFPGTFSQFNLIFGYEQDDPFGERLEFKPAPLYFGSYEYIETFFNLEVNKLVHFRKMIEITLGGRWYADAVGIFRMFLTEEVDNNLNDFIPLLAEYTDEEIKSFWHLFYDGPHPDHPFVEERYESLLKRLVKKNRRLAGLMEQAYSELLAEGGCPGH